MSSAEYSCKLFKPIFAYRQTVWTQIRLLLKEQSDLGPHCLQKWLLKSQAMTKQLHLKMSSVYVVCWIFLQTFQTYFCIQANSVDPDQTAPKGAVWSGSTLFAKMTFKITSNDKATASENVVCLCRLLNILANFSNLFLHTGKQCGPRSDCSQRSSLIWVHTVCKNDF